MIKPVRIVNHWTGGTYKPGMLEFEHYHLIIDDKGRLYFGEHNIEDNNNTADGDYAAHAGGWNTGAIGIACCGMANFKYGKPSSTKYPLTEIQIQKMFEVNANCLFQFNPEMEVVTHYELGKRKKTSSTGKPDISYLHTYPHLKKDEVGNFIRRKVKWYYQALLTGEKKIINLKG